MGRFGDGPLATRSGDIQGLLRRSGALNLIGREWYLLHSGKAWATATGRAKRCPARKISRQPDSSRLPLRAIRTCAARFCGSGTQVRDRVARTTRRHHNVFQSARSSDKSSLGGHRAGPARICRAAITTQGTVTAGPVRGGFHLGYEGRWIATTMSSAHLRRGLPHKYEGFNAHSDS